MQNTSRSKWRHQKADGSFAEALYEGDSLNGGDLEAGSVNPDKFGTAMIPGLGGLEYSYAPTRVITFAAPHTLFAGTAQEVPIQFDEPTHILDVIALVTEGTDNAGNTISVGTGTSDWLFGGNSATGFLDTEDIENATEYRASLENNGLSKSGAITNGPEARLVVTTSGDFMETDLEVILILITAPLDPGVVQA